jgi:hypothetical protein
MLTLTDSDSDVSCRLVLESIWDVLHLGVVIGILIDQAKARKKPRLGMEGLRTAWLPLSQSTNWTAYTKQYFSTCRVLAMTSRFCFHAEHAQYCILDAPGLNLDFCFQNDQLSTGADEIKRKIAVWQQMDPLLAADEISSCYMLHDYKHLVNSYPQSPLTLFSPLLRRMYVIMSAHTLYLLLLQYFIFSCVMLFPSKS